jgi:hypothetical protein
MYLKISAMNEFFNLKVGLRAFFSGPHWLAPHQHVTLPPMDLYVGGRAQEGRSAARGGSQTVAADSFHKGMLGWVSVATQQCGPFVP